MTIGFLESIGVILAVVSPLVVVPLTAVIFHLRSLRDQQNTWYEQLAGRADAAKVEMSELRSRITDFERGYTTKEEWLRECMLARSMLQQLTQVTVRLDTLLAPTVTSDGQDRVSSSLREKRTAIGSPVKTQTSKTDEDFA